MNQAGQRQAEWAFVAGAIEFSKASVYVERLKVGGKIQHRLVLKLWVLKHVAGKFNEWLSQYGRPVGRVRDRGHNAPCSVEFRDRHAIDIFMNTYKFLLSPDRKKQADLAFRYHRTMQTIGIKLRADDFSERESVAAELKALHAKVRGVA